MNIISCIHSTRRNYKPYLAGAVPIVNGSFLTPTRGTNGYNGIWDDRYGPGVGIPGWTLTGISVSLGNGATAFVQFPLPSTQYLIISDCDCDCDCDMLTVTVTVTETVTETVTVTVTETVTVTVIITVTVTVVICIFQRNSREK
jgi:hypothetical protein